MEAIILIGIQGSGKSTFYEQRFAATHRRLNLDTLNSRARERELLASFLEHKIDFVVDNTNVTAAGRQDYIRPAREANYRVIGYFFEPMVDDCLKRNEAREGKAKVPRAGFFGTLKRLQRPLLSEGFDELHQVRLIGNHFLVEPYAEPATGPSTPPLL